MKVYIIFPHMYNISPEYRMEVVRYYLRHGSFRKTARKFHLSYRSVFTWVDRYRKHGPQAIPGGYRRPWNRANRDREDRVVSLKERDPSLTLARSKEILEAEGLEISLKGIWGIWKRYGYAGFRGDRLTNDWTRYRPWSAEARREYRRAEMRYTAGDEEGAARILNTIPALPGNDLLARIPDRFLNTSRRAEKMDLSLGKTSLPDYLRAAANLSRELRGRNLRYSALRVGIKEVMALEWSGNAERQLQKIDEMTKLLGVRRPAGAGDGPGHRPGSRGRVSSLLFEPRFTLLISRGIALSSLMRIREGRRAAREAARMLGHRAHPSPYLLSDLAVLYSSLEEYALSEALLSRAIGGVDGETAGKLKAELAFVSFMKADYRRAAALGKSARFGEWESSRLSLIFQSALALLRGMPQRAVSLCLDVLSSMSGEDLPSGLFYVYFTMANAHCALGERERGERILRRLRPYLEKNRMIRELSIVRILLARTGRPPRGGPPGGDPSEGARELPTVRLALLLRRGRYGEALSLAKRKGILSYFYRYVLFFPEAAIELLRRGRPTSLPRTILRLPLFSREAPVFRLNFLGRAVLYRNRRYLRLRLPPKDLAFLIHLALRGEEPGKEIPLDDLYANFWRRTKNPPANLSHLLVRIRKALRIPTHLLEVDSRRRGGVLINRGIHLTTDYGEWRQAITRAEAFLRAGERKFARREYLRASSLLRGEPFRRMYDTWSEDARTRILTRIRSARAEFEGSSGRPGEPGDRAASRGGLS